MRFAFIIIYTTPWRSELFLQSVKVSCTFWRNVWKVCECCTALTSSRSIGSDKSLKQVKAVATHYPPNTPIIPLISLRLTYLPCTFIIGLTINIRRFNLFYQLDWRKLNASPCLLTNLSWTAGGRCVVSSQILTRARQYKHRFFIIRSPCFDLVIRI